MTGGNVEKKVRLVFEVADAGAARELGKIADESKKAATATENLKAAIKNTPSGGGGFPSMQGGGPTGSGSMDMGALARAGFTPSAGMNMGALAGANFDPMLGRNGMYRAASLTQAQFSGTSDPMLQTMNEAPKNAGMMAAMGAGAYRMGGMALRYGVPAIAALKSASAVASAAWDADSVGYQGGGVGSQTRALANGTWLTRNIMGIGDEFRGRSQRMANLDFDFEKEGIRRSGMEEQRQIRNSIQMERLNLEGRAGVLNADRRMARMPSLDRGTVTGAREYGEQLSLTPLRQTEIDREKDLKVSEGVLSGQERMRDEMERRSRGLELQRGQLTNQINNVNYGDGWWGRNVGDTWEKNFDSGVDKVKLVKQREGMNENIDKAQEELKSLDQAIEKSKADIVGLKAEVGRAKIGTTRGQLAILEQQEGVAANQAQRVGRMSELDYRMNRQAAEQVKRYGLGVLPPEWEARAEQYAPQELSKLYDERGIARNRDAVGGAFKEFQNNLPDIRARVDKGRNDVVGQEEKLVRDIANDANANLLTEEAASRIVKAAAMMMDGKIKALENKLIEKFNRG